MSKKKDRMKNEKQSPTKRREDQKMKRKKMKKTFQENKGQMQK